MSSVASFSLKTIFLVGVSAFLLMFFGGLNTASAQNKTDICRGANLTFKKTGTAGSIDCGSDEQGNNVNPAVGVNNLVSAIINIMSIVVGIIAVVMIIIGGVKFITSGGDSAKVTSARNTILYAILGLMVVALAQFIVKFVLKKATDAA